MRKKFVFTVIPLLLAAIILSLILAFDFNGGESTTEYTQIISKEQSSSEQWVTLTGGKKIYIRDISIWALVKENEFYTVEYDKEKSGYILTAIVPPDYDGQF